MFVHDGQFGFSLFRFVASAMVALFGPAMTGEALAIVAALAWFFAVRALAREFVGGDGVWAVAIFAVLLPNAYGAPYPFGFAELKAIPRPFAEARVRGGLAALAARREIVCLCCLGAAALLHPIMALAGFGVFVAVHGLEDKRWLWFCACAGTVSILAGALGLPLMDRLFIAIDPSVRSLNDFSQRLFVSKPLADRIVSAAHRPDGDKRDCRPPPARARPADPCGDHRGWFGRHSDRRDFWRLPFVASRRSSSALAHGLADGCRRSDGLGRLRR